MSDNSLKYAPRTHVTTVIVGAGQAGMSASYYLCQSGIDHVVLERYKRFHAWKEDRWDSFCLVTPNWQCKLPDFPYRGDDPTGFMVKDEIIAYVEGFCESFNAPLREGVTVTRVEKVNGIFQVDTDQGLWSADNVIIASGGYDRPITPASWTRAFHRYTPSPIVARQISRMARALSLAPASPACR